MKLKLSLTIALAVPTLLFASVRANAEPTFEKSMADQIARLEADALTGLEAARERARLRALIEKHGASETLRDRVALIGEPRHQTQTIASNETTAPATGVLEGRLVDENGAALSDAFVTVYDRMGRFERRGSADENGYYRIAELPTDGVFVLARAYGYVGEVFPDMTCFDNCDPTLGQRVELAPAPGPATRLDFVLDDGASIAGRVVDRRTGLPIPDIHVVAKGFTNRYLGSITDDQGFYRITGLVADTYRVAALPRDQGYQKQLFPDLPCELACLFPEGGGAPVDVVSDQAVTAIDFHLIAKGQLRGQVRRAGSLEPLAFGQVLFQRSGSNFGIESADIVDGFYSSAGLDPGHYLVMVRDAPGLVGQVYPAVECQIPRIPTPNCELDRATLVEVRDETVNAVDFELTSGVRIKGQIRARATGMPIAGASIEVQVEDGFATTILQTSGFSDASGRFTIDGLARGRVRLIANADGFLRTAYPDRPCRHCSGALSQEIVLDDEVNSGIDFQMVELSELVGEVRDGTDGAPISRAAITIEDDGQHVILAFSDSNGRFRVGPLVAGNYRLGVEAWGYQKLVLGSGRVDVVDGTTLDFGTPFEVEEASRLELAPIELQPAGRISGRLVGAAQEGCEVALFDALGLLRQQRFCLSSDPDRFEFNSLEDGTYFLAVSQYAGEFAGVLWPNYPCSSTHFGLLGCQWGSDSAIVINNQNHVEIEVPVASAGSLFVVQEDFGEVKIELFDRNRRKILERDYYLLTTLLEGLPVGDYYLKTSGPGLAPQLFPNLDCTAAGCPFEAAQKISIQAGVMTEVLIAPRRLATICADAYCLGNRFRAQVTWRNAAGETGSGGLAYPPADDFAMFHFFSPENPEVAIKILNACLRSPARFWVMIAGLTDLEVKVEIEDSFTGEVRTYQNPLGRPFPSLIDVEAFASCGASPPAAPDNVTGELTQGSSPLVQAPQPVPGRPPTYYCQGGVGTCLEDGRFKVDVRYRVPQGVAGRARFFGGGFVFFDRNNVEVVVKVLNGCAINGKHWVFAAGLTDVEVEIEVTDLANGQRFRHTSPAGRPFEPLLALEAFNECAPGDPHDF